MALRLDAEVLFHKAFAGGKGKTRSLNRFLAGCRPVRARE